MGPYERDRFVKVLKKAAKAEAMRFEPQVDLKIIEAYQHQRPAKVSVLPSPIPLYRCYFIEDQTIVTYMTHLLKCEYEIFRNILRGHNFQPQVELFVITDNKVILEGKISGAILAHLLFRFHHRIAKNYISDELFLIGGENEI
jgi:hypothetical protein